MDLALGRPERRPATLRRVHQVLVVGQAGRVRQQVAEGDRPPVGGKGGEHVAERVLVPDPAVAHEEHHRHGRERLGHGGEAEGGGGVDALPGPQAAQAIAAGEHRLPVLPDEHRDPGFAVPDTPADDGGDLCLATVGGDGGRRREGRQEGRDQKADDEPHVSRSRIN